MSDRLLKEPDVLRIAFQLPLVVNSAFADAVKALPSADRPQGEWLVDDEGNYICSWCKAKNGMVIGDWQSEEEVYSFCQHCGADMRGDNNETDRRR